MSLLIVASETSSPLCTDVAIPTDGQPQWWLHADGTRTGVHGAGCGYPGTGCSLDGPFPLWAGRWAEVRIGRCTFSTPCSQVSGAMCSRCKPRGAIVELVEVVGPSHHADECLETTEAGSDEPWTYCRPGAAPDCWHTPTGQVTVLDQPIPCERPTSYHDAVSDVTVSDESPTWWTAPEDIAAKLMEVTA